MNKHTRRSHRSYYPNKAMAMIHFGKSSDLRRTKLATKESGLVLGLLQRLAASFKHKAPRRKAVKAEA